MAIEQNGKSFTLKGLAPGSKYILEIQAVPKKGKASAWSKPIKFNTKSKDVAPADVTDLVAAFDGNTFNASWDGSAALSESDFSRFKLTITSDDYPLVSRIYGITSQNFSLSYDDNLFLFGNIAKTITIFVQAVDRSGNESTGLTQTAENAPPSAPTNVVVTAQNSGYQVSWDDPRLVDSDYLSTRIYESATEDGTYSIVYTSSTAPVFVPATSFSQRYVKISHIDTMGNESTFSTPIAVTPIQPVSVDITPPDQRTSITYTAGVGSVIISWANPTDIGVNGDLAGITVRYALTSSPTNYTWIDIPFTYVSPITTATINNLLPLTSYDFSISTFDKTQNRTSYSTLTTRVTLGDTTAPPRPKAPVVTAGSTAGGPMIVLVSQESIQQGTTTPLPIDTSYFKVFMLDSGFTTAPTVGVSTNLNASEIGTFPAAYNGGTNQEKFFVPLQQNEQRYFYTRAVDTSGNISDASLSDQSDTMTVFDSAYISTLTADKIRTGTLTAGEYIDVGPSSSNRIRIENISGSIGRIFSGSGVFSDAATGFYFDSDGKFSLKNRLTWNPSGLDPITGAATGLLTVKGSIEAQSGSFTGNLNVSTGSIYAGALPSSGARVVINSNGIAAFNSSSTNNSTGVTFSLDAATGNILLTGYLTASDLTPYATKTGIGTTGYTTIHGGNITTGAIKNSTYSSSTNDGSVFSTSGTMLNLDNGALISPKFRINGSTGAAVFAGELSAATGTFSGEITAGRGVFKGTVTTTSEGNSVYIYKASGQQLITTKPTIEIIRASDGSSSGYISLYRQTGEISHGVTFLAASVETGSTVSVLRGALEHGSDVSDGFMSGGLFRLVAYGSSSGASPGRLRIEAQNSVTAAQGRIYLSANQIYLYKDKTNNYDVSYGSTDTWDVIAMDGIGRLGKVSRSLLGGSATLVSTTPTDPSLYSTGQIIMVY